MPGPNINYISSDSVVDGLSNFSFIAPTDSGVATRIRCDKGTFYENNLSHKNDQK